MLSPRFMLITCCWLLQVALSYQDSLFVTSSNFGQVITRYPSMIVYYFNEDVPSLEIRNKVIGSIKTINGDLKRNDISLFIANCSDKDIPGCEDPSYMHNAIFMEEEKPTTKLTGDSLLSTEDAQSNLMHYARFPKAMLLESKKEFMEFEQETMGQSNVVIFYIPGVGSEEYAKIKESYSDLPKLATVAFATQRDLFEGDNDIMLLDCLSQSKKGMCAKSFFKGWSENFLKAVEEAFNVVFAGQNFQLAVNSAVKNNEKSLMLIIGEGEMESAYNMATEIASAVNGNINILLFRGSVTIDPFIQPRVEDGRTFAAAAKMVGDSPKLMDIGYLKNYDANELLKKLDKVMTMEDSKWTDMDTFNIAEEDSELYPYPENVLDDPIAFSLYQSADVKELYYFDYKTLPRLTDKTYEEVISSKEYSVILFTLEFNPRAIAALVTYAEIHKSFTERGIKSPLYRLECYNWPDVCQKAGVFTSPRIFFYPSGSTDRIEYNGLWDKVSLANAIERFRNPAVIIIKSENDIVSKSPLKSRSLIGFFDSDEGTEIFHNAAEMMRKDYQFVELHGKVAKSMASVYRIKKTHKTIVAFENDSPVGKTRTFNTEDDIIDYLKMSFMSKEIQELNIYSFAEIMKDSRPFVILFLDKTDKSSQTTAQKAKKAIQEIASDEKFANSMLFTWMDSSENSIGDFVLKQYNEDAKLSQPIAAFFDKKGSVMLTSCAEDCTKKTLTQWIMECTEGRIKATYSLNTEEWRPRLEGFNYLEMMKEEGTYPIHFRKTTLPGDEDITVASRGGRSAASMKKKRPTEKKESDDDESDDEKDSDEEDEKKGMKHEEL